MKDLLDLCRLNLLDEHIENSSAVDADITRKSIDYARRQIVTRMNFEQYHNGDVDTVQPTVDKQE